MIKIRFDPATGNMYCQSKDGTWNRLYVDSGPLDPEPPGTDINLYEHGTYERDGYLYIVNENGITRYEDGQSVTEVPE